MFVCRFVSLMIHCLCSRTAWRLLYALTVNGTTVEKAGSASDLNLINLQLDVTGPSGVKVQLASGIDISQLIPTVELLSFYSDNYVNYQTIGKVESQLRDRWTKILNTSGNYHTFLAHLSRRLVGELIVYQWSVVRRPSSASSTMLKDLLRNHWSDQSQI